MEETILEAFIELVEAVRAEIFHKWCEVLDCIKQVLETKQSDD